jgi:hypothetical protein
MKNQVQIHDEVEKTLRAFDNDPSLEPNPFLFTRIRAAMDDQTQVREGGIVHFVHLRQVVMIVILLANLITLFHYVDRNAKSASHETLVSALQNEYSLDVSSDDF